MPHYLIQASYTPEALAALTKNPQNRLEMVESMCKSVNGRLEAGYFSFGEFDVALIVDLPNNEAAAGLAIGTGGKGAIRNIRTTPLLSAEEAVEAMRVAGTVDYQPPG